MVFMENLDRIDYKILEALAKDGRISVRDLAESVNLSHTPTLKRMNRLREAGLIKGFRAELDEHKLGGAMSVFTSVSLTSQSRSAMIEFEEMIAASPEVVDCFLMMGNADYLLRVSVDSLSEFESFLSEKLSTLAMVTGIKSSTALRPVVQNRMPPRIQKALNNT